MSETSLKLIECPRDGMQSLHTFIPTELKISYINLLLKCGFDTLDMGSFVSPKIIPQLNDTAEVLNNIDFNSDTKLLTIVASREGAKKAIKFDSINYLGYPFSISETFQQRNINKSMDESVILLDELYNLVVPKSKELVLYLSMGFGNPYGDTWSEDLVESWVDKLNANFSPSIIAISDTVGCASPSQVEQLFKRLNKTFPEIEFGAHLHVLPHNVDALSSAAFKGGCRRFDSVIKGYGGCPMAEDDLTGNMPTELLLEWMNKNQLVHNIDRNAFNSALELSVKVFESNS